MSNVYNYGGKYKCMSMELADETRISAIIFPIKNGSHSIVGNIVCRERNNNVSLLFALCEGWKK